MYSVLYRIRQFLSKRNYFQSGKFLLIAPNKFALIIGNDGNGVSNDLVTLSDKKINIKTNSNLESLNVGVATSIILYEFSK